MADSLQSVLNPQFISGLIQNFPIKQMLSDKIYGKKISQTLDVSWDVVHGSYPMAPIAGMNSKAPMCAPPNITNMKGTAVTVKHKIAIKAADMLLLRKPGTINDPYGQQMILDYTARVNDGVDFRFEWLKMLALTGAVSYSDTENGVQFSLDYGFKNTHKPSLTSTAKWDDLTNSDPLTDIAAWVNLIMIDGGAQANKVVMNLNTLQYILNNSKTRDLLKYTTTADLLGRIKSYLAGYGLELEIAYGVYTASNGTNTPLVADKKVIVMATEGNSSSPAEKTAMFIDAPNEYTMTTGKYGITIEEQDPKTNLILAGQNGLPVIQFPDRIVCATVA